MNINPFDLRGPEFLVFYAILCVATALVLWLLRRIQESGQPGEEISHAREIMEDPYRMAFLRSGRYEVIQVALVSLIERGLLKANGLLVSANPDAAAKARHPLDKAILTTFEPIPFHAPGRKAEVVYKDTTILAEAGHIGEELQRRKLLPNDEIKERRKMRIIVGWVFLWLVAGLKIGLAVSRGRFNFEFLIVLALLSPLLLMAVSRRFRTALGDKTYAWIQGFFANLRSRRESLELNTTSSELTFLAAAFGMAALPAGFGVMIDALHLGPPKPLNVSGGSCGSSCASFGSCSGGSSCGGGGSCGGGCGGGCGGCGG